MRVAGKTGVSRKEYDGDTNVVGSSEGVKKRRTDENQGSRPIREQKDGQAMLQYGGDIALNV